MVDTGLAAAKEAAAADPTSRPDQSSGEDPLVRSNSGGGGRCTSGGSSSSEKQPISAAVQTQKQPDVPEIDMKLPSNHLDFSTILPSLAELEDFSVCYTVKLK